MNQLGVDLYLNQVSDAVARIDRRQVATVATTLLDAHRRGATVYTIGNGGSASLASHMACDLGKNTAPDLGRGSAVPSAARLRMVSLADNAALLTALGNDIAYADVFVEQLKGLLTDADVVVAVSGSGTSANVVSALEYARLRGATTIGFTGSRASASAMTELCDQVVTVPTEMMEQIEDLHVIVNHALTVTLRTAIANESATE